MADVGIDIDELVSLVSQRVRAEFRDSSRSLTDALANVGVDIDELGSLFFGRLRAELRTGRERFGRLRDSTR